MSRIQRSAALLAALLWAAPRLADANDQRSPAALRAQIEALKDTHVVWREVQWKNCLLDGLRESRAKQKPVLLWIFIDRPSDDERC